MGDSSRIYLDFNATTPLHPELHSQIAGWLEQWGNPSSIHASGRGPKQLLRQSREAFAAMVGAKPLEVVFTSGGSEAANLAIKGVFFDEKHNRGFRRKRILASPVEHPAVLKSLRFLESEGAQVEFLKMHRNGELDVDDYRSRLNDQTLLVCIMAANNETGSVFPIRRLAHYAHDFGALFFTDAVQALGKIPVDLSEWGVDLAGFAGHKFYGLKGAGALVVRKGVGLESLIHGGGQERSRRAGTENLLAIASLGAMANRAGQVVVEADRLRSLRDHMEAQIIARIPKIQITARLTERLPNTSSLVLEDVDGEVLLMNLDLEGVSVSTGSACSSGSREPSPALRAFGLSRQEANSSLRVSLGWMTTEAEVNRFVDILDKTVHRLRDLSMLLARSSHPSELGHV